jgi:uncharacterized repeat protein (TIGR01451 family)
MDPTLFKWSCAGAACPDTVPHTGDLSQTIATLNAGEGVTYSISATAAASPPAIVTNIASITGNFVCADGEPLPCTAGVSNPFAQADMQGSQTSVTAAVGVLVAVDMIFTNAGPDDAVNATCVVTNAPAGATSSCLPATPVTLSEGETIVCSVQFTSNSPGEVTLSATAGSDTIDPVRANNTAKAIVTVELATVSISKTADVPTGLAASQTEHYTVTVTNTSGIAATNVRVTDPVPVGMDPAQFSWTCADAACPAPNDDGNLDQTIPTLAPGASVTYTITATAVADPPEVVTNTASVTGNFLCDDGGPLPCTAAVSNPFAQADMQGSATAVTATVGVPVTVEQICTNAGGLDAVNATCVVSGAPAGATATCASSASPPNPLPQDGFITCSITFTPASTGQVTLTVTAGSDTVDPVRTNNTAQAIVTVKAAPPPVTPVTTLTDIALLLLATLLGVSAVAMHRRGR